MARNIIAGLDVGTSIIRIIITEQRKGEPSPRILSFHQCPSAGIKHGYITDYNEAVVSIKKCISEAQMKAGVTIKQIYLGIGGISLDSLRSKGSVIISRADSEVSEHDVKRAISQSEDELPNIINRTILHTIPINFKIDGSTIFGRPIGMKGKKLEVEMLFITIMTQHLDDLIRAVEEAGLAVNDVTASPIAESHFILNKKQKDAGVILANIGAETVSIVVFEEGAPISMAVFPIGSAHITNDIALGMKIPLEEAEGMKINYNEEAPQRKKLGDIIEARLHDIFELIDNHLKKIGRNGLLPAGIVLTGSGSNLTSLEDIAKYTLKLPAKIGLATLSDPKKPDGQKQLNDLGFSVAYGLCIIGNNESDYAGISSEITKKTKNILVKYLQILLP
ncbi:MAG: cell division protein FtsA [Patescibacteria group bacterium]|nr:cell division protein FtsA [Patescibacteria group bacterium]